MIDIPRNILLNPGPATTTNSVKTAQIVGDICPREKEFSEIMKYISFELTSFVASTENYTTVLFGGSGTAAVESIISSVIDAKKDTLLIINNGAYGKRICEIAQAYLLHYEEFQSSPYEEINWNELQKRISLASRKITHLAMVHHETTTGILNDIQKGGAICREFKLKFIVDAMSSYAGIPISMEKANIHFLASSSNKCIQGMAGVSFVIAHIESLITSKKVVTNNYYLNHYQQHDYFKKNNQMRFTPPVQVLYALKQAIIETKQETIPLRHARYNACYEVLAEGLHSLSLEIPVNPNCRSRLLTTVVDPISFNYSFDQMHDFLYDRGFTVYPGKIADKKSFRIANIGAITTKDMTNFIEVLSLYINDL